MKVTNGVSNFVTSGVLEEKGSPYQHPRVPCVENGFPRSGHCGPGHYRGNTPVAVKVEGVAVAPDRE